MTGEVCEETIMVEPNQMSEVYRQWEAKALPPHIEKHINFIDISDDGGLLVGSSTLNGRYWTGSLHYFNEVNKSIKKDEFSAGMSCQSVITEGKCIDSKDKIIIGEDSGCINLISTVDAEIDGVKSPHMVINIATYDHDSAVLSLSVSPDKSCFVSGSMDKCIKVWDTDGLITQYTFRPAHSHIVTSVQYSPDSNNIFASCSLDGYALMWDTRLEKPATEIKESDGEGLTSLSWNPINENIVAIGSNYGMISLYDVRSLKALASFECFNRPIHKLTYNSDGILAACGDTHEIKVLEYKNNAFHTIYSDERHSYFVRGLSWHPHRKSEMYSCGWDEQILYHSIVTKEDSVS